MSISRRMLRGELLESGNVDRQRSVTAWLASSSGACLEIHSTAVIKSSRLGKDLAAQHKSVELHAMNHNNLGDMFAHLSPEERLLLSYSLRSPMSAGSSFVQTSAALNSELFRAHAAPADRIALPTSWQGSNSLLNHLPPTPSMLASALVPPMQLSTEALHRTLLARGALNLPFPGLASESLSSQTDALLLQPHQRDLLNRELTKAAFMLRRDPQLMSFPVQTLPPLAALGEPGPVLGSASSAGKTKTVQSERSSLVFPKNCTSPQEASDILNVLGSTLRSKSDPFYDVSVLPYPRPPHTFRGGISR